MTIIGLGLDATEIDRVGGLIDRYGERFLNRVFTEGEIAYCRRRRGQAAVASFAARFAAKEAAMKAMGVGLGEVRFRDLEVRRADSGAPSLVVTGGAAELAGSLGIVRWHLSLSHSDLIAQAFVVAEG